MIDNQLHRHDGIDLGRVAALLMNSVTQAGQIDQSGLPQDVVTNDARRIPGKIEVLAAFDQLF